MWALCGLGVVATIRHLCLLRHQGPSHRGIVFFRLHSHLNGSQLPLLHSFPYTPPASSTTKTWTKQTWHGSTQRWNQTAPWPTTKNLWKCRGLKLHACHSNPDSWNISGNSTHKPPEHFLQNHWTKIWEILRSKVDSNSGTNLKTNRWSRKKKICRQPTSKLLTPERSEYDHCLWQVLSDSYRQIFVFLSSGLLRHGVGRKEIQTINFLHMQKK